MPSIYFFSGLVLLSPCYASNVSVPIEAIIECDSYISGTIQSSDDIKYYLFDDVIMLGYNNTYSVSIDLCTSQFDTIIYLYDDNLNIIESNDNSEQCDNNHQSQLQFEPVATFSTNYIIGIGGSNSEFGTYHIKVDCDINETMPVFTTFMTTDYEPTNPPSTTPAPHLTL